MNAVESVDCAWPNHMASTGYKNGCRCPKCLTGKPKSPKAACRTEGCEEPRIRYGLYCEDHRPVKHRRTEGKPERVREVGLCEVCGGENGWYESALLANFRPEVRELARRVCPLCRFGYMGAIKSHNLNLEWAIRLISARTCFLCREPFTLNSRGRLAAVVDHDHRCQCWRGPKWQGSCGECVRAIICNRCNAVTGGFESAIRLLGLPTLLAYTKP